jgi:hypothetical protein
MKPIGEHVEQRRIRERAIARRKKELGYKLRLIADELCESQSAASHNELIEYGIGALLNCLRKATLTKDKCAALAQHFKDSAFREDYLNDVHFDGNMLKLDGSFDIAALAKRILWMNVAEQYLTVSDDGDDDSRWGYDSGIEVAVRFLADLSLESGELHDLVVEARRFVEEQEDRVNG